MKNFPLLITVCICIAACRTAATTDPGEAEAVRVLYRSLNTPGQLTSWNANGGDPCGESWLGVTCKGSHVTEIKLPGLGLSGSLGYSLTSLNSLKNLDVSNNNLAGDISYQLPPNVENLNLANNQFTGNLPFSISGITSLITLNLAHNKLQGSLFDMFQQLSSLSNLDLSFNQLSGSLPQTFTDLSSLESMFLQNNMFTGTIDVLADLPLNTLNIENNKFTGWIPESLKKGVNLRTGGNTWNSGPAPPPPPGAPPANGKAVTNKTPVKNEVANDGKKKSSGGVIAGVIVSILVVGGIIAFFVIRKKSKRKPPRDVENAEHVPIAPEASVEPNGFKPVQPPDGVIGLIPFQPSKMNTGAAPTSLKPPPDRRYSYGDDDFASTAKPSVVKKVVRAPTNMKVYSIADLQSGTGSFSYDHIVGEALFGRVYRAHLGGVVLAVKKIDSKALPSGSNDEFIEIVSKLADLHHSNLSELVGYCSEHGQHLLAYEFHKNGSLHDFLHIPDEQSKLLVWNTRVRVALGVARALEYLHEICDPPIIHKNTCSENILLDSEFNAHLSDCLASFLPNADQILSEEGESGYRAPEVSMKGEHTPKSDVYSFGVVMLELLTGRQPYNSSRPRNEQSLVRWATPQLHDIDALSKMVDPSLNGLYPVKALSRFADVIALCVQTEPEFRPLMSEVVDSLIRLMQRSNMSKRTVGVEQREEDEFCD